MSAAQIKKQFGEEGYNVASVLIDEAEKVKYYTECVTDSNVAVEQAAIKSETLAAKLDQVKNELNEQGIELMKELNPAIVRTLNGLVNWSRSIINLIKYISEHRMAILYTVTAIGFYILAVKGFVIEEKLLALWNNIVKKSFTQLYKVILKHPYVAVIAVLALFIGKMMDARREAEKAAKAYRVLNDIQNSAALATKKEENEIKNLLLIAKDETKSKNERLTAIKKLNEVSPEYLGNLNLETINTQKATNAVRAYVQQLRLKKQIEKAQEKIDELEDHKFDGYAKTKGDDLLYGVNSFLVDKLPYISAYTPAAMEQIYQYEHAGENVKKCGKTNF